MSISGADDTPDADHDVLSVAGESVRPVVGDLMKRRFEFRPPGQIRWHTFFSKQVRPQLFTLLPKL